MKPIVVPSDESSNQFGRETREEGDIKRASSGERENSGEAAPVKTSKGTKSKSSNNGKRGGRAGYQGGKMNGPFNPMRNGPPYGGPPPYGFMGSSYGPHSHFHPHMNMGPYGNNPFMGPGKGPGFGPPHPGFGPPYGMPPAYPHHGPGVSSSYTNVSASSDSGSITSKGSMNSKKKRTIEGVHGNLPNAYSFRRTDSSSTSASTLTTGNNTSMETTITEDSRNKDYGNEGLSGINMDGMGLDDRTGNGRAGHRRSNSVASTASSLSVCGFSLASYEGHRGGKKSWESILRSSSLTHLVDDGSKGSKRQKKSDLTVDTSSRPPSVLSHSHSIDGDQTSRFEHLSIDNKGGMASTTSAGSSTSGQNNFLLSLSTSPTHSGNDVDATPLKANKGKTGAEDPAHRPADTPTPPAHGELGVTELSDDQSMLNRHLRGQSFTPLPHVSGDMSGVSPTHAGFGSGIAPQLSWSITGDTPSLGDLAEWDEENGKLKGEAKNRPTSTTSNDSMPISPPDFQPWKDEGGATTPLPVFFEPTRNDGSENQTRSGAMPQKASSHFNDMHMTFMGSGGKHPGMWSNRPDNSMYPGNFRDDGFGVGSPHHTDRRDLDFYPYPPHFGGPNDRIRNLRGRVHPHMPPMPIHIPPPMSAHLPMTSPMGMPGKSMWSPHHGMGGHMGSPHHLGSPLASMAQSKRKCVPLKPPIPSKFQGDVEKTKAIPVPEFTNLVNFPTHMSQKQAVNLPDGMRCCVMCGQACPCSTGHKGKKGKCKAVEGPAPRNDHLGDKNSGYAIIPTQNKGLCTLCDVNVWVVVSNGLEIKWCKGCKNFRPWAAFGDKGLATKCLRCRERQREKYALQKEEKEKARAAMVIKNEG